MVGARRFGDNPISGQGSDLLGRSKAAEVVSNLVLDEQLDTPLTVGVFGDWGSGKTSFMRLVQQRIPEPHLTIWFDAWHYAHQEGAMWRALLLAIIESLRRNVDKLVGGHSDVDVERTNVLNVLEEASITLYRSYEYTQQGRMAVNWRAAIPIGLQLGMGFVPGGKSFVENVKEFFGKSEESQKAMKLLEREQSTVFRQQIESLEQFQELLRSLLSKYLDATGEQRHLFVFIDDLDRCVPDDALAALEALKVFLDVPGCVFIVGMDRRLISRGVLRRFGFENHNYDPDSSMAHEPTEYLEKIIQLPFALPPLTSQQVRALIASWAELHGSTELMEHCSEVILAGVQSNPRKVKRTLNVLLLARAMREEAVTDTTLLAKLVVLQTNYEGIYDRLVDQPRMLKALEAASIREAPGTEEAELLNTYPKVRKMLQLGVTFSSVRDEQLEELFAAVRTSYVPF